MSERHHWKANHWEALTWKDSRKSKDIIDHSHPLAHYWILIGPRWGKQNQQPPLWPILLGTRWGHCLCSRFLSDSWHHRLVLHFLPSSNYYQACCRRRSGKLIKNAIVFLPLNLNRNSQRSEVRGWCSEGLWYDRTVKTYKLLLVIRLRCSFPTS